MKLATLPCWEFSRIVILCYGCPLSDFRDIFNCPCFLSASLLLGFSLEPTNLSVGQANLLLPQCISNLLQHNHLPQTHSSLKQYTVLLSVWSSSFVCFRILTRLQSGGLIWGPDGERGSRGYRQDSVPQGLSGPCWLLPGGDLQLLATQTSPTR